MIRPSPSGKACVKIGRHRCNFLNGDRLREKSVKAIGEVCDINSLVNIKMRRHPSRMNPGIGTPRAGYFHFPP